MGSKTQEIIKKLSTLIKKEEESGEEMFLGRPNRWIRAEKTRCQNDHVTSFVGNSIDGNVCTECGAPAFMTFPEDESGPLDVDSVKIKATHSGG
jgi:hypothetical protein